VAYFSEWKLMLATGIFVSRDRLGNSSNGNYRGIKSFLINQFQFGFNYVAFD